MIQKLQYFIINKKQLKLLKILRIFLIHYFILLIYCISKIYIYLFTAITYNLQFLYKFFLINVLSINIKFLKYTINIINKSNIQTKVEDVIKLQQVEYTKCLHKKKSREFDFKNCQYNETFKIYVRFQYNINIDSYSSKIIINWINMIIQNCQMTQDFIGNLEFQLNFESIQQNSIVPDGSPTFAHHKQFNHVNQNVSIYSNIGNRSENLDQFDYYQTSNYQLFAIYDGHGDSTVSKHLKNNLLKTLINHPLFHCDFTSAAFQTFHFIENEILMRQNLLELNSGSVAIIVLIRDNCVYTVNLGDCRALLVDEFANYKILNRQHNLDNFQQYETIKQKGGIILRRGKSFRLNGQINISRSFGDKKHKEYMSSVPEISITPIRGQKYIVMGSDGFWNEASNKKVAQSLLKSPKIKNKAEHLYNLGPKAKDNSTIICISLTN